MIDDLTKTLFDAVLDPTVGLGRRATYTARGVEVAFNGDFDEEAFMVDPSATSRASTTQPRCGAQAADFPSDHPRQDGVIVFETWPSRRFVVDDIEPAEVGWIVMHLREVP